MTYPKFIKTSGNAKDIAGQKFGRLTAIGPVSRDPVRWLCECECGNQTSVVTARLISGHSKSCGCINVDMAAVMNLSHGMSGTRVHKTWMSMHNRCRNKNNPAYKNYGGRGITVCKRWSEFENFYEDMGKRPEGKTLERRDNDMGYCPDNCKWATRTEQNRNTRVNVRLTLDGVTRCIAEWSEVIGIKASTIEARVRDYGWSDEKALTTPLHNRHRPANTYEIDGKQHTLQTWADKFDIKVSTVRSRIYNKGWSVKRAITEPVHVRFRNKQCSLKDG